jgi:hypothetical protein
MASLTPLQTPSPSTNQDSNKNTAISEMNTPGSTIDNPIVIDHNPEPVFTLFPKLPVELRDLIWKHAAPGPRVIKIKYTKVIDSDSDYDSDSDSDSDSDYLPPPMRIRKRLREKFYKLKTAARHGACNSSNEQRIKRSRKDYLPFIIRKGAMWSSNLG